MVNVVALIFAVPQYFLAASLTLDNLSLYSYIQQFDIGQMSFKTTAEISLSITHIKRVM